MRRTSAPAAITWPAAGKELTIFGGSVRGTTVTGATVLGGLAGSGWGAANAEAAEKAARAATAKMRMMARCAVSVASARCRRNGTTQLAWTSEPVLLPELVALH